MNETIQIATKIKLTGLPVVNGGDEPVAGVSRVAPPLEVVHQRVQELFEVLFVSTGLVNGPQGVRQHRHLCRI